MAANDLLTVNKNYWDSEWIFQGGDGSPDSSLLRFTPFQLGCLIRGSPVLFAPLKMLLAVQGEKQMPELLSTFQAAKEFQVPPTAIQRAVVEGRLPGKKDRDGNWKFLREDVRRWVASRKRRRREDPKVSEGGNLMKVLSGQR
jgi:hypothetical protein